MEIDKQLLNDYFMGKEIYPNDIESIKKYREHLKGTKNAKIVEEDGLSYLLKQDDESSLVTSYGIICPEISRMNNNDYFKFLIKEIYRVTPKNGITMHVHGFEKEKAINLFGFSGFKPLGDWMLQFVWKK